MNEAEGVLVLRVSNLDGVTVTVLSQAQVLVSRKPNGNFHCQLFLNVDILSVMRT